MFVTIDGHDTWTDPDGVEKSVTTHEENRGGGSDGFRDRDEDDVSYNATHAAAGEQTEFPKTPRGGEIQSSSGESASPPAPTARSSFATITISSTTATPTLRASRPRLITTAPRPGDETVHDKLTEILRSSGWSRERTNDLVDDIFASGGISGDDDLTGHLTAGGNYNNFISYDNRTSIPDDGAGGSSSDHSSGHTRFTGNHSNDDTDEQDTPADASAATDNQDLHDHQYNKVDATTDHKSKFSNTNGEGGDEHDHDHDVYTIDTTQDDTSTDAQPVTRDDGFTENETDDSTIEVNDHGHDDAGQPYRDHNKETGHVELHDTGAVGLSGDPNYNTYEYHNTVNDTGDAHDHDLAGDAVVSTTNDTDTEDVTLADPATQSFNDHTETSSTTTSKPPTPKERQRLTH